MSLSAPWELWPRGYVLPIETLFQLSPGQPRDRNSGGCRGGAWLSIQRKTAWKQIFLKPFQGTRLVSFPLYPQGSVSLAFSKHTQLLDFPSGMEGEAIP